MPHLPNYNFFYVTFRSRQIEKNYLLKIQIISNFIQETTLDVKSLRIFYPEKIDTYTKINEHRS